MSFIVARLPVQAATTNLIVNPSLETANGSLPASWQTSGWGTNSSVFSYLNTGHTGTKSAAITVSSYTSGDAKWLANPVAVTPGASYEYNDYYESNVSTRVVAAFADSSGSSSYVELPAATPSANWAQYDTTFTVPAAAVNVTIYHLIDSVGTLTIDDVSLSLPAPSANPIVNPSLETSSGSLPANWLSSSWGSNTAAFNYVSGGAHTGDKSAKLTISNYVNGDAKWYFTPITSLIQGSQYGFSAWYKTNTQPHVVVAYTDVAGTDQYFNMPLPLPNGSTTSWQQYSNTFDVPQGATSVTIYMLIASNGWLQVDDYAITPYTPVGFSEPLVSLSFDDGLSSTYRNGLPLLKKYGFGSTQYIISGKLNTTGYMTTSMVRAFLSQGSEIGAHTATHPNLTLLTATQLNQELSQSQAKLRNLFGPTVAQNFASPYGAYDQTVLTNIQKYYLSHRSTDAGFNSKDNLNLYDIRVQNINTVTTPAQVAAWVTKAQADKTWLVLVYHDVTSNTSGSDYAVTPTNLDTELANIKASGIPVKTISQALNEVTIQR